MTVRWDATRVEIRLRRAATVRITVLDPAGKPVPGATVSARRDGTTEWSTADDATTDEDGVAHLPRLDAAGRYSLAVRAWNVGTLLPHQEPGWTPADTTVRLARAFAIQGIVRDGAGRAFPEASVWIATDHGAGGMSSGSDGTFTFSGLAAGEHELWASLPSVFGARESRVRVAAGTRDVVLRVDPGLDLVVRIDDWVVGETTPRQATLYGEESREPFTSNGRIAADGSVRFRGLEAGSAYTLWVSPAGDDLSLLQRGLRQGSDVVHVKLARGRSITGRLVVPYGARARRVMASQASGTRHVMGIVNTNGTYDIPGLPDGIWRVRATAERGRDRLQAEAEAPAGASVDLELR